MNKEFLKLYEEELYFIRQLGSEFAKNYPKIAARLELDTDSTQTCADPYIERLLEGFAFLSAGVKHKLDARFPVINQHLLELTYPQFLAPLPSMMIVQLKPDYGDQSLLQGVKVPKGSVMHSQTMSPQGTRLTYSSAHEISLWPLDIDKIDMAFTSSELQAITQTNLAKNNKAGLRIRLSMKNGNAFEQLESCDQLSFFIDGDQNLSTALYEQIFSRVNGVIVRPVGGKTPWYKQLDASCITHRGFDDSDALLPISSREFSSFRLLQENLSLPERIRFFCINGLEEVIKSFSGTQLDIIILFDELVIDTQDLELLDKNTIKLNCTPAINLFAKSADPTPIRHHQDEFQVIVERTKSSDYEVHSISSIVAFAKNQQDKQKFKPLYEHTHDGDKDAGFYTVNKRDRQQSANQKIHGVRSNYLGTETFIALQDPNEPPYRSDLSHLHIKALCTNRDLPLILARGNSLKKLLPSGDSPIEEINTVINPTPPGTLVVYGSRGWSLLQHLSINYITLLDDVGSLQAGKDNSAISALKNILHLYNTRSEIAKEKKINAVTGLSTQTQHYRLPVKGPITYVQGHEITLTCDENGFAGDSLFQFGHVISAFFERFTSLHSVSGLTVVSEQRGELKKWTPSLGHQNPF